METLILWLGFLGSWLLFAGPIYQAALELQEQDIESDRIRATGAMLEQPAKVSPWWWLIPPVKLILERRRSNKYKRIYIDALLPEDAEALISFLNKATAWLLVAIGGLCIAIKETYELAEGSHWDHWVFWLLVFVLPLLSILHTISRIIRAKSIIKSKTR